LHLDCYIQQVLAECKAYIKKMLLPKKVQTSPDLPEVLDQHKQKYYQSFVVKLQFATWVRIDIAFTVS
jgi:hypothetical protein